MTINCIYIYSFTDDMMPKNKLLSPIKVCLMYNVTAVIELERNFSLAI